MENSSLFFKEVLLQGKKTGKIKHMIVIDEDENEDLCRRKQNTLTEKQASELIIQKLNYFQKGINVERKSAALIFDLEEESQKASHFYFRKPNTRRSLNKPVVYYSEENYAKIPELLDSKSFLYKKMIVRKCVELRVREYINI